MATMPNKGVFNSFSGADIVATIDIPGESGPKVIGELQTITYSIHREKSPVRALGFANAKGFTFGSRTIAGTLIFTVFNKHIMDRFRNNIMQNGQKDWRTMGNFVTDELPPFNVTITFMNEFGYVARMAIYGVTIIDEGQTMSIDDMITENVMSYMARDIELMNNL
jgi:hypothetical protein